jgi:hypothetical protein
MDVSAGGFIAWVVCVIVTILAAREAARRKGYNVAQWSILVLLIPPLLLVLEMKRPLVAKPEYTNYVLEWAGSLIALLATVVVLLLMLPAP